jgi:hypothetical protein
MHSVCVRKPFDFFIPGVKESGKTPFKPLHMNPAEVRLEIQILVGGLSISGFLLLAAHLLG